MPTAEILRQKGFDFLWITPESEPPEMWMCNLPGEVLDQEEMAEKAFGDVLVVGYGLGMVQGFLLENPKVTSVLTVELNPEVIAEVKKGLWSG